nr:hypothetical protein [Tanacetum cinerariifolium]
PRLEAAVCYPKARVLDLFVAAAAGFQSSKFERNSFLKEADFGMQSFEAKLVLLMIRLIITAAKELYFNAASYKIKTAKTISWKITTATVKSMYSTLSVACLSKVARVINAALKVQRVSQR